MNDWEMMRCVRDAYWRALEQNDPAALAEAAQRAREMGFENPEDVTDEIIEAFGKRPALGVRGMAALE